MFFLIKSKILSITAFFMANNSALIKSKFGVQTVYAIYF